MNSRKRSVVLYVLAAFLAACAAFAAAGFAAESARAETAAEITQSGADFISSAPQEETTYRAGSGTLTYIPAPQEGGAAQIVFDNAEIESGAYVNYWSENRSYAAVAARGDVELVLKGESKLYLRPSGSTRALLFYDSNVTVTGDGSLSVGFRSESVKNLNAYPMEVIADNDVPTDDAAYAGSGNFELKSGTLTLNGKGGTGQGCLTVNNRIAVSGGTLQTLGQMAGVYSPYGDIEITGGEVRAENFNVYGLYARRGSVSIGGDAEVTVSSAARSSAIGISGGNMGSGSPDTQSGGNVYIRGGNTAIEVPYIGVFVQYAGDTESGKIEIMGGTFSVNVTEGTQNIGAALYAQGAEADVVVRGGTIGAVAGGSNGQATFGIYADRFLQVEGGSVRAGAENTDAAGSSFGVNAEEGAYVTGGSLTAHGGTSAIGALAPHCGQGVYVQAASDAAGENTVGYDEQKFDSYKYLNLEYKAVISVSVTPATASAERGKTLQFTAEVLGEGSFDTSVGWKISGASDPATKIDGNGMLTVCAGETAESFTVTAVSVFDPEKSASAVVTVLSGEPSEPGQDPSKPGKDPSEPGQDPSEPGGGLPAGAIAAIVLGSVVLVAAAAVAVWFIVKRSGKKN